MDYTRVGLKFDVSYIYMYIYIYIYIYKMYVIYIYIYIRCMLYIYKYPEGRQKKFYEDLQLAYLLMLIYMEN